MVGALLGWGIVYLRGLNSTKTELPENRTVPNDQTTRVVVGGEQVTVEKQLEAEVVGWDGASGELAFKLAGRTAEKIKVDSSQMSIFVPEAQHKTDGVLPVRNGDKNWPTAFCPGDGLTVGYDSGGAVRLLFNTGYRMCGIKFK